MQAKYTRLAKALIGAALGVTLLGSGSAGAKDWKSVTIALDGSYAPWNLTLPGGKLGGFEPELVENLCARAQIQCKLVAQDWDGMIPGLQAGKFDVLMDAISITPDREKIIAFSKPYAATPATFAVSDPKVLPKVAANAPPLKLDADSRSNAPAIESMRKALKGKTIGIQSGTVYTGFINANFKDVASVRVYKTAPERDLDLANGRIDATFDDVTYYTANADKFDALAKVALGKQITAENEVTSAEPLIASQRDAVDKLKTGLVQMKEKLAELKSRRDTLVARQKSAQAQIQVQTAIGSINVLDPTSELSRFEDKVRRQEAYAQGQAEIAASSLDSQFAELESSDQQIEVEARLAALKSGQAPQQLGTTQVTPQIAAQ